MYAVELLMLYSVIGDVTAPAVKPPGVPVTICRMCVYVYACSYVNKIVTTNGTYYTQ
jgi:hypothetical protein